MRHCSGLLAGALLALLLVASARAQDEMPAPVLMQPLQIKGANVAAHFNADFPAVNIGGEELHTAADDATVNDNNNGVPIPGTGQSLTADFQQQEVTSTVGPAVDATPLSDQDGNPVNNADLQQNLYPVRIVSSLGGAGGRVQSFVGNAHASYLDGPNGGADAQEVSDLDRKDPVFIGLVKKLGAMKIDITNDQNWINDVKQIVQHYQQKIRHVQTAMRQIARETEQVKRAIGKRHKFNRSRILEEKLHKVQAQLEAMHSKATSMVGKAQVLESVKGAMTMAMNKLRSQINQLRAAAGSA